MPPTLPQRHGWTRLVARPDPRSRPRGLPPVPPVPPRPPEDGGDGNGGCWGGRHLPVVTVGRPWRKMFRRQFRIRCWECDLNVGPFETWAMAHYERQRIEGTA